MNPKNRITDKLSQLTHLGKEMSKKGKDVMAIWSEVEGISLFLNGDLMAWGSMFPLPTEYRRPSR